MKHFSAIKSFEFYNFKTYLKLDVLWSNYNVITNYRNREENGVYRFKDNNSIQYLIDQIPSGSFMKKHVKQNALGISSWDDLKFQITLNLETMNYHSSKQAIYSALYSTNPMKNIAYALRKKRKGSVKAT